MRLLVCPIIPISPRSFSPVPSVPGRTSLFGAPSPGFMARREKSSFIAAAGASQPLDFAGSQAVEEIAFSSRLAVAAGSIRPLLERNGTLSCFFVGFSNRHPKTRTGSKRDVPGEDLLAW